MGWIDSVVDEKFPEHDVALEPWKVALIDSLYDNKIFKFGTFKLKSGRRATSFLNFGDVSDGEGMLNLSNAYAEAIMNYMKLEFDTILGPAYKGIPLAVATSMALASKGENVGFTFDRKEEKAYGEATGVSRADAAKKIFVGYIPKDESRVLLIDDVITTGLTKDEEIQKLKSVAPKVKMVGLIIAGNRQELDEEGNEPLKEMSKKYDMPVHSLLNVTTEIIPFLDAHGVIDKETKRRLAAYTRTYGTEDTKYWTRDLKLLERDKGIIPACDVPLQKFEEIVQATKDIDQVVAYKLGFETLADGLNTWVKTARKHTDKPIIYDHQKAMTDIPDTGKRFAQILKNAGVDAAIGFPQSGPATQWEWTHSLFEQDLEVLIGGEMTHPKYKLSEGGYLSDEALTRMYVLGAKSGVNNFVVPGNKVERATLYNAKIKEAVPGIKPALFSPGLVAQGGVISDVTKQFDRWYGIVGRGVYGDFEKTGRYFSEKEIRDAAFDHVSKL